MNQFLQQHKESVTGMLSGWDRLRARGTLRVLASVSGLRRFLACTGRLLKDFGGYAEGLSRQVRAASLGVAESAGRPVEHLKSPSAFQRRFNRSSPGRWSAISAPIQNFTRASASSTASTATRSRCPLVVPARFVLRVETTINNVRDLKSPRIKDGKKVWRPMRKGVADVPRRAEVSQASNDRYLQAMAAVNTPTPLKTLTDKLSQRVNYKGKPVRGLNLLGPDDAKLLQTIGGGEYIINGFRNRDLQTHLFDNTTEDPKEQRRRSGQITRQITRKLRMLRAHGLIKKVPHTHRYHLSDKGRQVIIALQAAREADIEKLAKAA